jgi:hypothetical protein
MGDLNDKLPTDEVMREMARLAMEQATVFFARMADEFAIKAPADLSGADALRMFAAAIRSTNAQEFCERHISRN